MQFHLDDTRPETPSIDRAISLREAVLLSIIAHLVLFILMMFGPRIPWINALLQRLSPAVPQQAQVVPKPQADNPRFVYTVPRVEIETPKAPPRAELSDRDRIAQSPERAPTPRNSMPFARGNSTERVDAQKPTPPPRGQGPQPEPQVAQRGSPAPQRTEETQQAANLPPTAPSPRPLAPQPTPDAQARANADAARPTTPGGGSLGQALKNLQQYTQQESFNNLEGDSGRYGQWLQFDNKGVEFGPWVRRFIAQVKRNWFIPYAAMSLKGRVVLQFNVHKNGQITDLQIVQPSGVDAFNNAAFNALRNSSPTHPLPPEYPSDKAFFTVTFFYNEQPPSQD